VANRIGGWVMSKIYMVVGCLLLAFSSYAVEPAKSVKVALATEAAEPVKAVKAVKPAQVKAKRSAKWVDEGDSRINDYRLERESCCGPQ
jgi:hypothetical protein